MYGPREASASYVYTPPQNDKPSKDAFLDIGLPTERYAKAETNYYPNAYLLARVGIRATADSDPAAAALLESASGASASDEKPPY